MEYSKEYYRILQKIKQWPDWKVQAYNKYVAISTHAKKLEK